ncbi:MAG: hypothetical protein R6V14_04715 [Halanaerobiales bacterium]
MEWKKHEEIIDNLDTEHLIIEDKNRSKIGYAIIAGLQIDYKSIELRRIVLDKKNQGYGTEFLNLMK